MATQPIVRALDLQGEETEDNTALPFLESVGLMEPALPEAEDWTDIGVLKSGYLFKERDTLKGWRPRYFTLDPDFLHYFLSKEDISPRKSLQIDASVIVTLDSSAATNATTDSSGNSLFPFTIRHPGTSLSFRLAARSIVEAASWVKYLQAVITKHHKQEEVDMEEGSTPQDDIPQGDESTSPLGNLSPSQRKDLEFVVDSVLSHTVNSTHQWSFLYDTSGVTATRTSDKNGNFIIRGESILPYSILELFGTVSRAANRKILDPMIESYERKKWFNLHTGIEYVKYYAKWPASSRDFCNLTHWRLLPNNTFLMVGVSMPDESCPVGLNAETVRARLFFGGYVMQPLPPSAADPSPSGRTKVSIIVKSNLGGSIPKSIVEFASRKQPMAIASVREFLDRKYLNGEMERHPQPEDHDQLFQQLTLIAQENVGNSKFSRSIPLQQLPGSVSLSSCEEI
jgi:hypothetical protein